MKVKGNGQGKILSVAELQLLFAEGFTSARDRALYGICLYTGCRVSEALALQTDDFKGGKLVFRKSTTKGKLRTRTVDVHPNLRQLLTRYQPAPGPLFPGMRLKGPHLTRCMADLILKKACRRIGIVGVSTHSFRRTALTQMSSAGIPLRTIQEISGHSSLEVLQRYLEVSDEQKLAAINKIGF